jgi:hypothetical protein
MSKSVKDRELEAATKCLLLCVENARLAAELAEPHVNRMMTVKGNGQAKPDKAEVIHVLGEETIGVIMNTLLSHGVLVPPKPKGEKPPAAKPAEDKPEDPPKPRLVID